MNKLYRGAICRHCNLRKVGRTRGLCFECFYAPGVRDLYPITSKYAPKHTTGREPTEAELDALIASQLHTMPAAAKRRPPVKLAAILRRAF